MKSMEQFTNPLGLLLPKGYLSHSQIDLWERDKNQYRAQYYLGAPKLRTRYTEFGKKIAEMIENGFHIRLLPTLIVYPVREFEIKTVINDVPVLCYLDQYNPDTNEFRDDKTAKKPWTQSKVQKTEQLLFYSSALRALTGKPAQKCYIDWIETVEGSDKPGLSNAGLRVTGKVVPFSRIIDPRENARFEEKLKRIAIEISNDYKAFISTL